MGSRRRLLFSQNPQGPSAKPACLALGALIIKERLGASDEEAVEQIRENPYLQYFLGFHEFRDEAPFDPSMYVHFRKRFSLEQLGRINEAIVQAEKAEGQQGEGPSAPDNDDSDEKPSPGGNCGNLLIDATCAPADIRYPTDINLSNESREKTEQIIDALLEPLKSMMPKFCQ
jgi:IS5 family transposase